MAYDELWAPLDHLIEKWDFRDLNAIILAEGFSTENINDHTKCSYGELLLLGPDGNHDRNCRAQSQIGENTYTLQNDKVDVNQFDKSGDLGVEAGEISHLKTGLTSADLPHHIPIVLKCGAEEEGLFWSTSRSTWPDENPNKIPAPIYAPDEYCEDGYGSDSKCNDGNDEKGGDEISNKDPCSEYTCAGYKDRGGDEIDTQSVVMQDVNIDGTRYINGYICTNTGGSNYEWVSFIELNEQNDGDDNDLSHPIFDCDDDM